MMRHRMTPDGLGVAAEALASCLAGVPLRRRRYLRLLTTIEGEGAAANVSTGQYMRTGQYRSEVTVLVRHYSQGNTSRVTVRSVAGDGLYPC